MIHIGLICPATLGHLNPTLLLGKNLHDLGYRVSYFGWIETKEITENQYKLHHIAYLQNHRPDHFMADCLKEASALDGLASNRYTFDLWTKNIKLSCEELAELFQSEMIDLLLADHALPEVSSICDYIKLPFITICNAMVSQTNLLIPGNYYIGNYSKNPFDLVNNIFRNLLFIYYAIPMMNEINKRRIAWGMKRISNIKELYSSLAVICQQTKDIEYPLSELNKSFDYVGPFIDESLLESSNIIKFNDDLPVIYASLGTINTGKRWIYSLISKACQELDVNLVISVGHELDDLDRQLEADNVQVFSYIDQLSLLAKCDLCITHAGMNTTMHCVYTGTPMIAIPIANEQPGIASRIQYSGSGLALDFNDLTKDFLKDSIQEVLNNSQYSENIMQYKHNCLKSGGLKRAIQIIIDVIDRLELSNKSMLSGSAKTF